MFAAHPRPFRGIVRAHRARFPTHDDILSPIGVKFHSKCKRDARIVFSPRRRGSSSSSSFLQPHRRRQSLAETRIRVIIKVAFPLRRRRRRCCCPCCCRRRRINHRLFLLLCRCVFFWLLEFFCARPILLDAMISRCACCIKMDSLFLYVQEGERYLWNDDFWPYY